MTDLISMVVQVGTLLSVGIAAWQLTISQRSHTAKFEAQYTARYERLLSRLPDEMVLGRQEIDSFDPKLLRVFYDYFMLCDEQLAARRAGRVNRETWDSWRTGMGLNLRRPSFEKAWIELDDKIHEDRLSDLRDWRASLKAVDQPFDPKRNLFSKR